VRGQLVLRHSAKYAKTVAVQAVRRVGSCHCLLRYDAAKQREPFVVTGCWIRISVCALGRSRPGESGLNRIYDFLVLSPAIADALSELEVWLHHDGSATRGAQTSGASGTHGRMRQKLAHRRSLMKLQPKRLFVVFSILSYAKKVNPRICLVVFSVVLYAKNGTHTSPPRVTSAAAYAL